MRLTILLSCLFLTLSLSLSGCASKKVQKNVQEEVAKEPVKSDSELYSMEEQMLSKSTSLSDDQRERLRHLFSKTKSQNDLIDNEIMKTKAVLFKSLISDAPNKTKVNTLETQLLKLSRKKTRYSLSAYREAKSIVGKDMQSLDRSFRMIDYNKSIQSL